MEHWRAQAVKAQAELQALQEEWKEMTESTSELEKTLLAEIEAVRAVEWLAAFLLVAGDPVRAREVLCALVRRRDPPLATWLCGATFRFLSGVGSAHCTCGTVHGF